MKESELNAIYYRSVEYLNEWRNAIRDKLRRKGSARLLSEDDQPFGLMRYDYDTNTMRKVHFTDISLDRRGRFILRLIDDGGNEVQWVDVSYVGRDIDDVLCSIDWSGK